MTTARDSSASSGGAILVALAIAVVCCAEPSAHRLDEYLQAARIGVDPDRVELELVLTPGVALADSIIADIDRDDDGLLSLDERQSYAQQVLSEVELAVDGRPLRVQPLGQSFPELDAVRRGEGAIRVRSDAAVRPLSAGPHELFFRNSHRSDVGVYLANALVPESNRIDINAQRRDNDQQELIIEYVIRPEPAITARGWLLGVLAGMTAVLALLMRWPRPA